ncbi:MAG: ankyrin repeat domain-containing protein [Holosporales bacterium]|nr:ankyrin repeat domain-containing protein [Holosporales bacterium]
MLVLTSIFNVFGSSASRPVLSRTSSDPDIHASAVSPTLSFLQKLALFCWNNAIEPPPDNGNNELTVLRGLDDLAEFFGCKAQDGKCYIVDISWQSLKNCAEKIIHKAEQLGRGENQCIEELRKILELFGAISHEPNDRTKTGIRDSDARKLADAFEKRLDFSALSGAEATVVKNVNLQMISNYSGFQLIMSILVANELLTYFNFDRRGFFSTIPIFKGKKGGPSVCVYGVPPVKIGLAEKNFVSNNFEAAVCAMMHELTHAFHGMMSLFTSYGRFHSDRGDGISTFYSDFVPFLVSSVVGNDALRGVFFPVLSHLDFGKNVILKEIKRIIGENIQAFEQLKQDLKGRSRYSALYINSASRDVFYMLSNLVQAGFGEIILGESWERNISYNLTEESFAKAIYVSTLLFRGDTFQSVWTDNEEILTIVGILPFLFNGQYVILVDKQNEIIFQKRNLEKEVISEKDAKVYRAHHDSYFFPSSERLLHLLKIALQNDNILLDPRIDFSAIGQPDLFYPPKSIHRIDATAILQQTTIVQDGDTTSLIDAISPLYCWQGWQDLLHSAILLGQLQTLEDFVAGIPAIGVPTSGMVTTGYNVDDWEGTQWGPTVHMMLNNGFPGLAKILIEEKGAKIDSVDSQRRTALHCAAENGHRDIVELLLSMGAQANAVDFEGRLPIHLAARKGSANIVDMLTEAMNRDNYQCLPIHFAACSGNVDTVQVLVRRYPTEINARDSAGKTPLAVAVENGQLEIVRFLTTIPGVEMETKDASENTLLHLAAQGGDPNMAAFFVKTGKIDVNVRNKNWETPLLVAVKHRQLQVVNFLLDNRADVNAQDYNLATPLHWCALMDMAELAEILLAREGVAKDVPDSNGNTPLNVAAQYGSLDVVRALMKSGTRVDIQNTRGLPPLHNAVYHGQLNVIDLLLNGRGIETRDRDGRTPLMIAVEAGNFVVISKLIESGADVNARDDQGNTPLHLAVINPYGCDVHIVELLLQSDGIRVDAQNKQGETPLSIAGNLFHFDAWTVLSSH